VAERSATGNPHQPTGPCHPKRGFCRLTGHSGIPSVHAPDPDRAGQPSAKPRAADWEGSEIVLTEIKLKKGEPVEKALRRLKKRIDREGTLKEVRSHRRYEKPSEKRRRKLKVAKFTAMLRARYADM